MILKIFATGDEFLGSFKNQTFGW